MALAQSGGSYEIERYTVDGGGAHSSGGSYTLTGTAGQPDTGALHGGAYTVLGGFWGGGETVAGHRVYLPVMLRNAVP